MAQARHKPPRSRTLAADGRQYQNAVADLIGSFRGTASGTANRGLRGEYYKSRQTRKENRVIERVDPAIRFDFKDSSPEPGKIEPPEFSIRWQGSVLAPETGEYEFMFRTENGARLWVNDLQQPLDRRLGEIGQRHRIPAVDSAARRPGRIRSGSSSSSPRKRRRRLTLLWQLPHSTSTR